MALFDHDSTGTNKNIHLDCTVCLKSEVEILRWERGELQNRVDKAKDDVFEHLILLMQSEFGYGNGAITTNEIGELRRILTQVIDGLETGHSAAQALSSLLARIEVRD